MALLLLAAPFLGVRLAAPCLSRSWEIGTRTRSSIMIETSTSSFEPLLIACREACDAMLTLVRAVYESEEFGVERKSKDGSAFTLADGLVQVQLMQPLTLPRSRPTRLVAVAYMRISVARLLGSLLSCDGWS